MPDPWLEPRQFARIHPQHPQCLGGPCPWVGNLRAPPPLEHFLEHFSSEIPSPSCLQTWHLVIFNSFLSVGVAIPWGPMGQKERLTQPKSKNTFAAASKLGMEGRASSPPSPGRLPRHLWKPHVPPRTAAEAPQPQDSPAKYGGVKAGLGPPTGALGNLTP